MKKYSYLVAFALIVTAVVTFFLWAASSNDSLSRRKNRADRAKASGISNLELVQVAEADSRKEASSIDEAFPIRIAEPIGGICATVLVGEQGERLDPLRQSSIVLRTRDGALLDTASTDEDGHVRFPGSYQGEYQLTVGQVDTFPVVSRLESWDEVNIHVGKLITVEGVCLLPNGDGVADAEIYVSDNYNTRRSSLVTTTDAFGYFRASFPIRSTRHVGAYAEGVGLAPMLPLSRSWPSSGLLELIVEEPFDCVTYCCEISFAEIADFDQGWFSVMPRTDAHVVDCDGVLRNRQFLPYNVKMVQPDRLVFDCHRRSDFRLVANVPGAVPTEWNREELLPAPTINYIEIGKGLTLDVKVNTTVGSLPPSATIEISARSGKWRRSMSVESDGRAQIQSLPKEPIVIAAQANGYRCVPVELALDEYADSSEEPLFCELYLRPAERLDVLISPASFAHFGRWVISYSGCSVGQSIVMGGKASVPIHGEGRLQLRIFAEKLPRYAVLEGEWDVLVNEPLLLTIPEQKLSLVTVNGSLENLSHNVHYKIRVECTTTGAAVWDSGYIANTFSFLVPRAWSLIAKLYRDDKVLVDQSFIGECGSATEVDVVLRESNVRCTGIVVESNAANRAVKKLSIFDKSGRLIDSSNTNRILGHNCVAARLAFVEFVGSDSMLCTLTQCRVDSGMVRIEWNDELRLVNLVPGIGEKLYLGDSPVPESVVENGPFYADASSQLVIR